VHGTLTRKGMRNLEELLQIWTLWKPKLYSHIRIIPENVLDIGGPLGPNNAIAAFSGGVDATFTAVRHAKLLPDDIRYPLTSLLMVQGFDVALSNSHAFTQLMQRVQPLVADLGLQLRTVRTNSKELCLQNWEDSFALELAACLHMFNHEFRYGLIGSSEPYDALILPWGSTPVTDHLMSGDCFSLIHDGAGYSRTDKVAEIARNPIACKTLKVCWEGEDRSGNCGGCEKCIRTRLNFLAASNSAPSCFSGELDLSAINSITIKNAAQLAELSSIVNYAGSHGVEGAWLPLLKARIARSRLCESYPSRGAVSRSILMILSMLGLKKPIKQLLDWFRSDSPNSIKK